MYYKRIKLRGSTEQRRGRQGNIIQHRARESVQYTYRSVKLRVGNRGSVEFGEQHVKCKQKPAAHQSSTVSNNRHHIRFPHNRSTPITLAKHLDITIDDTQSQMLKTLLHMLVPRGNYVI